MCENKHKRNDMTTQKKNGGIPRCALVVRPKTVSISKIPYRIVCSSSSVACDNHWLGLFQESFLFRLKFLYVRTSTMRFRFQDIVW